MWSLVAKILGNKYKDTFVARLGATLTLGKLGVVGNVAKLLTPFVAGFIGILIESGVFRIDLTLDALDEGRKLAEFETHAKKAYDHAISKVHTEEEKRKIRQDYLDIISKFNAR